MASGTSGRGDNQTTVEVQNLMVDVSESIRETLRILGDDFIDNEEQTNKPKIPRVRKELRNKENLKKYLEPRVVSIGPYHHQNPNLKANEDLKIKLAGMFIKEHKVVKEHVFRMIKAQIEDLKSFYATQEFSGDDELALMFLIDGCVVLHFIYVMKHGYDEKSGKFKGLEILQAVTDRLTFQMDIMLLENQLPYQLLDTLILSTQESDREQLKKSIQEFILRLTYSDQEEKGQELDLKASYHLLDLMWTGFTSTRTVEKSCCVWLIIESFKLIGKLFHLLPYIISKLLDILMHKHTVNVLTSRNIEELTEAGVKLKLTNTGSLTDIKFSNGTLKLPLIVVNKVTAFKFLNLIAYEISAAFPHKFEVSSFIFFLASLMGRPQDVKELRVNRILHNYLDSDEEVVKLFKEIRTDDLEDAFVDKYSSILEDIQEHCKRKYNVWMAQFKNWYFQSPWTVIALLGAPTLVVLTSLQTVYTILGYHDKP